MINVLPDKGRSVARTLYLVRFLSLGFFLASGFTFFMFVALLPAYLSVREEAKAAQERLALAESALKKESETSIGKDITFAGKALPLLAAHLAASRPTLHLDEIFSARDPLVRLSRLEFRGGESPTVRVSGTAATREALISFNRKLSVLPSTPRVDLPVSNLAKNENASFTLTIQFGKQ